MDKQKIKKISCPKCGGPLGFLMPLGKTLHCDKCDKYYINDNNSVGSETSSPYKNKNVLY